MIVLYYINIIYYLKKAYLIVFVCVCSVYVLSPYYVLNLRTGDVA